MSSLPRHRTLRCIGSLVATTVGAVLLTGCTPAPDQDRAGGAGESTPSATVTTPSEVWPPELVFTEWTLGEAEGTPQPLLESPVVSLTFDREGFLFVQGACQPMSIRGAEVGDGQMGLAPIDHDPSACPDAQRRQQDEWIVRLLESDPRYEVRRDGDFLILEGSGMKVIADHVA